MTRTLLDEARQHDAAMTEGPWEWVKQRCVGPPRTVDHGLGPEDDRPLIIETDSGYYPPKDADREGIAWLRTNLRGLLDGYEQALSEVERLSSTAWAAVADDLRRTNERLRVSIGEQALVIEQQDRDMERMRAELNRAVSENFAFNVKVATEINEARSDRERLRAAITALHTDAEHWLTESDDRPNLRAAENRLAAILKGAP